MTGNTINLMTNFPITDCQVCHDMKAVYYVRDWWIEVYDSRTNKIKCDGGPESIRYLCHDCLINWSLSFKRSLYPDRQDFFSRIITPE